MPLIARRYLLVLWAILARPWPWLVLAIALTLGGLVRAKITGPGFASPHETVPLVARPPNLVAESLRELARKGRLDTVTDFNMGAPDASGIEGGFILGPDGRPVSEYPARNGNWQILDQLPALKRLWLPAIEDLTAEGWQRIGKHPSLELLSMRLSSVRGGVPEAAHAALIQLPRLRYLDVFDAGGGQDFLVPPLPALETITLDSRSLEENLRRLAAGSPRLATISLQPPGDFRFTRGILESLKKMPNLRRLYIASFQATRNDAADRRQIATLRAALPGVSVLPGVYSTDRVWTALVGSLLLGQVPGAFWFQAAILLGTPLGWMLPGRLAPHLFWPLAVSSVCGCLLVAVAQSLGIAWTPAITLAVFFTLAIPTAGRADVGGVADRISTAAMALMIFMLAAAVATALLAPWVVDRWLCGEMPLPAAAILLVMAGISVWQVARYARLPRIYARQGLVNPPGLVLGTAQQQQAGSPWNTLFRPFFSWSAVENAESLQRLLTYGSVAGDIDQQIARPVPAPFADMLRRPLPRTVIVRLPLLFMAGWLLYGGLIKFTTAQPGKSFWAGLSIILGQVFFLTLLMTGVLWLSRRDSLRLEFLRPVSRHDYWRGLRQAIARDLWFPAGSGAACLALSVALRGTDIIESAIVGVALFCGWVAGTHAILLLAAVTRRPLIVTTLAMVLLFLAFATSGLAMGPFRNDRQFVFLIAAATLAIGFTIRSAVLYRLEDREIG